MLSAALGNLLKKLLPPFPLNGLSSQPGDNIQERWDSEIQSGWVCGFMTVLLCALPELTRIVAASFSSPLVYLSDLLFTFGQSRHTPAGHSATSQMQK